MDSFMFVHWRQPESGTIMEIPAFPKSPILCVIDVNDHPDQALRIAVKAAEANHVSLTVLYPYRLTGVSADLASKSAFDVEATESIKLLASPFLKDTIVNCEFLAEVGFMKDRVYAFLRKNRPGLVIFSKGTANRHREGLNELLDVLEVPFMIVPQTNPL
jgi:hypothetical protein